MRCLLSNHRGRWDPNCRPQLPSHYISLPHPRTMRPPAVVIAMVVAFASTASSAPFPAFDSAMEQLFTNMPECEFQVRLCPTGTCNEDCRGELWEVSPTSRWLSMVGCDCGMRPLFLAGALIERTESVGPLLMGSYQLLSYLLTGTADTSTPSNRSHTQPIPALHAHRLAKTAGMRRSLTSQLPLSSLCE